MAKLAAKSFRNADVVAQARSLLGKVLCTRHRGRVTAVAITETEAYAGMIDRASHAYGDRRTARTEVMYRAGGCAYVYLCYGLHHLFNVVTGPRDTPHAVLVRAGVPFEGIAAMERRRNRSASTRGFSDGPGKLSSALGITTRLTGESLRGERIWLEDRGIRVPPAQIVAGPRIGVDYAGEDAKLPYRFTLAQPLELPD